MPSISRQHHYLSQCYLRGFTKAGSKDSKLSVIDLKKEIVFESNTRNVGGVRDFDRIRVAGVESDIINQQLSSFESLVALSLRNIEKNLLFNGADKDNILNLIALLAVRSPQRREHWRKFQETIIKKTLGMMVSSKETWEARSHENSSISYDDAKSFYEQDEYTVNLSTEHHIEMEMVALNAIVPLLAKRKWVMIKASPESGPFITTDRPVFLVYKNVEKVPAFLSESPGFAMPDTQIQFPISKNLALIGEFDGNDGVVEADKQFVAVLNSKMLFSVHQRVFAPTLQFNFLNFFDKKNFLKGTQLISFRKNMYRNS